MHTVLRGILIVGLFVRLAWADSEVKRTDIMAWHASHCAAVITLFNEGISPIESETARELIRKNFTGSPDWDIINGWTEPKAWTMTPLQVWGIESAEDFAEWRETWRITTRELVTQFRALPEAPSSLEPLISFGRKMERFRRDGFYFDLTKQPYALLGIDPSYPEDQRRAFFEDLNEETVTVFVFPEALKPRYQVMFAVTHRTPVSFAEEVQMIRSLRQGRYACEFRPGNVSRAEWAQLCRHFHDN